MSISTLNQMLYNSNKLKQNNNLSRLVLILMQSCTQTLSLLRTDQRDLDLKNRKVHSVPLTLLQLIYCVCALSFVLCFVEINYYYY